VHLKQTYLHLKNPYVHLKETCVDLKETCVDLKETNILAKESLCTRTRDLEIRPKIKHSIRRKLYTHKGDPCTQNSPNTNIQETWRYDPNLNTVSKEIYVHTKETHVHKTVLTHTRTRELEIRPKFKHSIKRKLCTCKRDPCTPNREYAHPYTTKRETHIDEGV